MEARLSEAEPHRRQQEVQPAPKPTVPSPEPRCQLPRCHSRLCGGIRSASTRAELRGLRTGVLRQRSQNRPESPGDGLSGERSTSRTRHHEHGPRHGQGSAGLRYLDSVSEAEKLKTGYSRQVGLVTGGLTNGRSVDGGGVRKSLHPCARRLPRPCFRGNSPPHRLRCRKGLHESPFRPGPQRRPQDPDHSTADSARSRVPRPGLPLPGLHLEALRRPPHRPLGRRPRNEALEPRAPLPPASPPAPRGGLPNPNERPRRRAVRPSARTAAGAETGASTSGPRCSPGTDRTP